VSHFVPRRTVLATGATTAAALPLLGRVPARADHPVFAHGVASGDPLPRAVLIWTRVTPAADATPGSGRGPSVTVRWEVATDAAFTKVVRRGEAVT
jgi:alkaline phosphatase D